MSDFAAKTAELLELLRAKKPLVHHITNFVVMNDTANITMHIGGLPVMAHSIREVEEMVNIASVLVLNPGTLDDVLVESMLLAGKQANKKGIPIILDPVGAGATSYRTAVNKQFLNDLKISVVRGNAGELGSLAGVKSEVKGVESIGVEGSVLSLVKKFAKEYGVVAAITGKDDFISDGEITYQVSNGHQYLQTLTGTGCMSTTVVGAFAAIADDKVFSTAAALSVYGLSAELASISAKGPASFKAAFFDQIYNLKEEEIIGNAKIEQIQ